MAHQAGQLQVLQVCRVHQDHRVHQDLLDLHIQDITSTRRGYNRSPQPVQDIHLNLHNHLPEFVSQEPTYLGTTGCQASSKHQLRQLSPETHRLTLT